MHAKRSSGISIRGRLEEIRETRESFDEKEKRKGENREDIGEAGRGRLEGDDPVGREREKGRVGGRAARERSFVLLHVVSLLIYYDASLLRKNRKVS